MWSLITSTVLDSEGQLPEDEDDGDDDVGDDVEDTTVVRDEDCFEAMVGVADPLSTLKEKEGEPRKGEGANAEVAVAEGGQEAVPTKDNSCSNSKGHGTFGGRGGR